MPPSAPDATYGTGSTPRGAACLKYLGARAVRVTVDLYERAASLDGKKKGE
jgi:hypothetical protein